MIGGAVLTFLIVGIIAIDTFRRNDDLFKKLLLFGLITGILELATDHWAVAVTETLVYPSQPLLWSSPFFMPLSWTIIMVQFGFIALFLLERWGMFVAIIGASVLGGINIPLYEFLSSKAGFWHYQNCAMIFDTTPYYVIFGEVLLASPLAWIALQINKGNQKTALGFGILEGAWILVGSVLSYALFGKIGMG